jgi:membrane-bound serine protease (ClpP class)
MMHFATVLAVQQAAQDPNYLFVAIGLLVVGVTLFVLEFFVPSGGLLAILTAVSMLGSIGSMFAFDTRWGMIYGAVMLASAPFAIVQAIKIWSGSALGRRAILSAEADRVPRRDEDGEPIVQPPARPGIELGTAGTAVTVLRPVGFVDFDGTRTDAVAESGYVAEGERVIVIGHVEGQPKVRAVTVRPSATLPA